MAEETIWDPTDIKVIRKSEKENNITLVGFAFSVSLTFDSVEQTNAEFARISKEWHDARAAKKAAAEEHARAHEKMANNMEVFANAAKEAHS